MWFDPSMEDAYTEGIKPAIQDAGYEPLRIDRVEHINKIDDEIIKEIRRSQFVVADFTSDDKGARGGLGGRTSSSLSQDRAMVTES